MYRIKSPFFREFVRMFIITLGMYLTIHFFVK